MTRVSSFGHMQSMLTDLLRNQSRVVENQEKINTGKVASNYKGLSRQAATLLGAKTLQTRTEQYISAGDHIKGVLQIYDHSLKTIDEVSQELRQNLMDMLAQEEVYGFEETLKQTLNSFVSALNTQVGGAYVYSGTRTETEPVAVKTLGDLIGLPAASDAFTNVSSKPKAKLDENVLMEYGVLASDVGQPLMQVLKSLAEYNAGAQGPFDGKLSDAQIAFLKGELANLDVARNTILGATVANGVRAQRLDRIFEQHESTNVVLSSFISDIEDVNMAEAVTNLNNDQVALQASYKIMAQLTGLSLLDFLR